MGINITTTPIDVTVDGVTFNMQGDPTATPDWVTLLETEVVYGDAVLREKSHQAMIDAMSALAETPEDADIIRSLTAGTATLKTVCKAYIEAVTGFPTQPPPSSKKR